MIPLTLSLLISRIDFTLLDPNATEAQIREVCIHALEHRFASVCVRPNWVMEVAQYLFRSDVRVCTVISFHEGANSIVDKVAETRKAIADGAQEIDWVFDYQSVREDYGLEPMRHTHLEVDAFAELVHEFPDVIFKAILETCALEYVHKAWVCSLIARATQGLRVFVKTSTGYGTPRADGVPKGATVDDVQLMLRSALANPFAEVKASGGLRSLNDVIAMHDAGATRFGIGWESALKIVEEAKTRLSA